MHGPRGILSEGDLDLLQDHLGSVRMALENSDPLAVNGAQNYAPYGDPFGGAGALDSTFGFTGEQTDGNGQVYLRARYYDPSMAVFTALDPFEGAMQRPMSMNGYSWVEGNPVNAADPTGFSQVHIWASAFIMPEQIRFPYVDPLSGYDDFQAIWKGVRPVNFTDGLIPYIPSRSC